MADAHRGRTLTVFAVLFATLALSNFLKPLPLTSDTGFVLFGQRLSGAANAIIGPLFGAYVLAYAVGIWRMRRYALAMGYVYVVYVVLNLVLFNLRNPPPPSPGYRIFGIVYSLVAVGVSGAAVYVLHKRKAELAA